jgi:hypothetical protein
MAELTTPGGTSSPQLVRLGRDAAVSAAELGPLADLVGTWIGTQGWELIAVPAGDPGAREGFTFIARPYTEVVSFTPIGAPVPDRGGPAGEMLISGLMYEMRIADLVSNEPLHLETGMWLYLADVQGGQPPDQPIVRSASIPHGDSLLALGTSSEFAGPPVIPMPSAVPDPGPTPLAGYLDDWQDEVPSPCDPAVKFNPATPNQVLNDALAGLDVVRTTTLSVSTDGGGGILNIPFVDANANATRFACDYWIETIEDTPGGGQGSPQLVQQLQYSQQTNIEFLPQFGNPDELIMWPHVNVNTLRKQ